MIFFNSIFLNPFFKLTLNFSFFLNASAVKKQSQWLADQIESKESNQNDGFQYF